MNPLNIYELSLMIHALGVNSPKPFYRNHSAVNPGGKDDLYWRNLMEIGLAKVKEPNEFISYRIYSVTEKGIDIIKQLAREMGMKI